MLTLFVQTAAIVAGFVAIHLFIGKIRKLDREPRSGWLSFAGGTAVAYVFLHVLPELAEHQESFSGELSTPAGMMSFETWIYALSLLGLAFFYGIERAAKLHHPKNLHDDTVLWIHTASFAGYNLLIGYLLVHREDNSQWSLALYAVAMGFHFVTTDHGMLRHHRASYDRVSRWILCAAIIGGWVLGMAVELSELAIGCLFAFLAGSVVLNVLKEELPAERESRIGPFLLGTGFYAMLLMVEQGLMG